MGTDKRARQKAARQSKIEELQQRERRQVTKRRTLLIGGGVVAFIAAAIGWSVLTADDGDSDVATDQTTIPGDEFTDDTTPESSDPDDPSAPPTTNPRTPPSAEVSADQTPCPAEDGSSERVQSFAAAPPLCIDLDKEFQATMTTDAGVITIDLDPQLAPATVNNFVYLARYHYYDGLTFHRVVDDFVIQGGDPEGNGSGGPGYSFQDELPLPSQYGPGSLAMANSGPDTNGSQFFIVTSDNGANSLVQAVGGVAAYSLFGEVVDGFDVVKAIEADGSEVVHVIESVEITEL